MEALLDDENVRTPEDGAALCLSGGGYRAMLFHVGAIIRLDEAGILSKLSRISSVSGGSITAAALALRWKTLDFSEGKARKLSDFVNDIRSMADTTVDMGAIIGGAILPGSISDRVSAAYDRILFRGATLQDLPDDTKGEGPRFVLNATNIQSAALWRFSRPYMGDYRIGLIRNPTISLAKAVAASSAFPPFLSPCTIDIAQPVEHTAGSDLSKPPYIDSVMLCDGGVYDNLGLETVVKRYTIILVSDAGQKIAPEESPHTDWARHSLRILDMVDNQVRSLRKRHLIDSYIRNERVGTYWGVRTNFKDYGLDLDPLGCIGRDSSDLAEIPTRLERIQRPLQDRLMNWGYAICDAALRRHVDAAAQAKLRAHIDLPSGFPFADGY